MTEKVSDVCSKKKKRKHTIIKLHGVLIENVINIPCDGDVPIVKEAI